jgi:hypothetical protein
VWAGFPGCPGFHAAKIQQSSQTFKRLLKKKAKGQQKQKDTSHIGTVARPSTDKNLPTLRSVGRAILD